MAKVTCPVSGDKCVECGLYRARHVNCSFFKRNIEIDYLQEEIRQKRRQQEEELTAEGVWDIKRSPKKSPK